MSYCRVVLEGAQFIDNSGLMYEIPSCLAHDVHIGSIVYAPFGKKNFIKQGIVVSKEQSLSEDINPHNIKSLYFIQHKENVISDEMITYCKYIAEYYAASLMSVLKTVIPKYFFDYFSIELLNCQTQKTEKIKKTLLKDYVDLLENNNFELIPLISSNEQLTKHIYEINLENYSMAEIQKNLSRSPKKRQIIEYIYTEKKVNYDNLKGNFGNVKKTLEYLLNQNYLSVTEASNNKTTMTPLKIELNPEQENAYKLLSKDIVQKKYSKNLLNGVTGSGKTLVYEKLIEVALNESRQALILVPEITLSTNIYERLANHFSEGIGIIHSQMSEKERYGIWNKVKNRELDVVVGPRSAVFLPFRDLGLIVIDEEHEDTFKQNEPEPRYHAMICAEYLAKHHHSVLLLGSATPSIQTLYDVVLKNCRIFNLPQRYQGIPLPEIKIIDMLQERKIGNQSIFSRELKKSIEDTLSKKEQVILFINKKGFSSSIQCKECGATIQCPKCDIPLTYYKSSARLKCNYCDFEQHIPHICPNCGSKDFYQNGIGTESIEEICKKLFPNARCRRIDGKILENPTMRESIFSAYENNDIDILIGTQIIAKGLDFKNTTCVGVINADLTLNMADFRASERCFQLMVQVAGRAGRDKKLGYVYIQTYQPNHYALIDAQHYDLKSFFKHEIAIRQQWHYPPIIYLTRIILSDTNVSNLEDTSKKVLLYLKSVLKNVEILGPAYAPILKKNNRYRMHILLKTSELSYIQYHMNLFKYQFSNLKLKKTSRILIDIEPENIL